MGSLVHWMRPAASTATTASCMLFRDAFHPGVIVFRLLQTLARSFGGTVTTGGQVFQFAKARLRQPGFLSAGPQGQGHGFEGIEERAAAPEGHGHRNTKPGGGA